MQILGDGFVKSLDESIQVDELRAAGEWGFALCIKKLSRCFGFEILLFLKFLCNPYSRN